ncbi:MAG: hypothetical protein ACRDBI_04235, partial [Shewanella sp.]
MKLNCKEILIHAILPCLVWTSAVYADNPAQMKMTTPIAPGVAVPDKIESSIGTLNLSYGYPSD